MMSVYLKRPSESYRSVWSFLHFFPLVSHKRTVFAFILSTASSLDFRSAETKRKKKNRKAYILMEKSPLRTNLRAYLATFETWATIQDGKRPVFYVSLTFEKCMFRLYSDGPIINIWICFLMFVVIPSNPLIDTAVYRVVRLYFE